ncbi:MAG: hypothetical protein WAZ98_00505 [Cyclobacteriaceae bacterium]
MKVKLTHKEYTLLAGIVVALIILLAFWLQPASTETGDVSRRLIPPVSKPTTKAVVEKAVLTVQQVIW